MKKKILITQPQFTKHQVFDESVLDILKKKYDVVFINKKNKYPYILERILSITFMIKITLLSYKYDNIVLLSYDHLSLLFFRPKNNSYVFIHNSCTNIINKNFLSNIYKFYSNKLTFVSLSESMHLFFLSLNIDTPMINHPIVIDKNKIPKYPTFYKIAVLNSEVKKNDLEYIQTKCIANKFKVFMKYKDNYQSKYLHMFKIVDNMHSIINNSDFIIIPKQYNYRVSCIAYETVYLNKFLFIKNCFFAHEIKKQFPKFVYIYNHIDEIFELIANNQSIKDNIDISNDINSYNKKISENLYSLIN